MAVLFDVKLQSSKKNLTVPVKVRSQLHSYRNRKTEKITSVFQDFYSWMVCPLAI
jgi:hypothetical protein